MPCAYQKTAVVHNLETVLLQRPQNPGVESIVISFAQKTFANGQLTSKLHVIELGAPAGQLQAQSMY